jgi:hypothetical protein
VNTTPEATVATAAYCPVLKEFITLAKDPNVIKLFLVKYARALFID